MTRGVAERAASCCVANTDKGLKAKQEEGDNVVLEGLRPDPGKTSGIRTPNRTPSRQKEEPASLRSDSCSQCPGTTVRNETEQVFDFAGMRICPSTRPSTPLHPTSGVPSPRTKIGPPADTSYLASVAVPAYRRERCSPSMPRLPSARRAYSPWRTSGQRLGAGPSDNRKDR